MLTFNGFVFHYQLIKAKERLTFGKESASLLLTFTGHRALETPLKMTNCMENMRSPQQSCSEKHVCVFVTPSCTTVSQSVHSLMEFLRRLMTTKRA